MTPAEFLHCYRPSCNWSEEATCLAQSPLSNTCQEAELEDDCCGVIFFFFLCGTAGFCHSGQPHANVSDLWA